MRREHERALPGLDHRAIQPPEKRTQRAAPAVARPRPRSSPNAPKGTPVSRRHCNCDRLRRGSRFSADFVTARPDVRAHDGELETVSAGRRQRARRRARNRLGPATPARTTENSTVSARRRPRAQRESSTVSSKSSARTRNVPLRGAHRRGSGLRARRSVGWCSRSFPRPLHSARGPRAPRARNRGAGTLTRRRRRHRAPPHRAGGPGPAGGWARRRRPRRGPARQVSRGRPGRPARGRSLPDPGRARRRGGVPAPAALPRVASSVLALAYRIFRGAQPAAPPFLLAMPVAAVATFMSVSYLWTWDDRAGAIALAFFVFPFTAGFAVVARAPLAAWLPAPSSGRSSCSGPCSPRSASTRRRRGRSSSRGRRGRERVHELLPRHLAVQGSEPVRPPSRHPDRGAARRRAAAAEPSARLGRGDGDRHVPLLGLFYSYSQSSSSPSSS